MTNNRWIEVYDLSKQKDPFKFAQNGRFKGIIVCMGDECSDILNELTSLYLHTKSRFLFIGNPQENVLKPLVKNCLKHNLPIILWSAQNGAGIKEIITKYFAQKSSSTIICSGKDESIKDLLSCKHLSPISLCGYQRYLCSDATLKKISKQSSEILRLGEIRDNIQHVEPMFRDKDLFIVDFDSVRYADYPLSTTTGNPNGLYAEELCQIVRYIGLSLGKRSIILTDSTMNCKEIINKLSICYRLIAQTILHICIGICDNTQEDPYSCEESDNFEQKIVKLFDNQQEIEFITSLLTGRWWFKIPIVNNKTFRFIPCSKEEYDTACSGELPYKWLFFYQNLNLN